VPLWEIVLQFQADEDLWAEDACGLDAVLRFVRIAHEKRAVAELHAKLSDEPFGEALKSIRWTCVKWPR
jgi:hypothetical protein